MATENLRSVQVVRRFEFSAERVFDAWLDRNTAGQWLFAHESRPMIKVEIDPRVGGSFKPQLKACRTSMHSWGSRSRRGIGTIDFCHNLLPDFQISELSRPTLNLCAAHAVTGDAQDSCNVPQMPITAAFREIPKFAEDHVFWGGNDHIAIREEPDGSPPAHLYASPLIAAREDEVDLVPRAWMNHVKLK
jgi:hypothetical protein